MSSANPVEEFCSHAAAIEGFAELIRTGFQNPEELRGTVKVLIPEYPEHSFIVHYDDALHIEPNDMRLTDTQVSIPIATIERIFKECEFLDWRDPSVMSTISFEGDLHFANHLAKSCLRPSTLILNRFRNVGKQHLLADYKNLTEIEYLQRPSQLQILEAMHESRPVVITGLEPTTPCCDCSLDKLVEKYGDATVRVRSAIHRQNMREFVQELKAFEADPYDKMIEGFAKPYTEGAALPEEMWSDFGPMFFSQEDFIPPQLWLGSVPTHIPTSSLHRDPHTGFLLQVIGKKRLDLYSADQAELLYPHKAYNNYQPCWFKPEAPNFNFYPKAKEAKCLSLILAPGELLLQPAGWFHQVYALDSPNMSVSYFWRY